MLIFILLILTKKSLVPISICLDLILFLVKKSKRQVNEVNRCQYCTCFFVDSHRLSCDIERNLTFKKSHFNADIVKTLLSENFRLNFHYVSVVPSVHNDVMIYTGINFGIIYTMIQSVAQSHCIFYV